MGVRFDRTVKQATNGPMIFFNDPASLTILAEEIKGALISGLSFYCYRQPGALMITFGSSEGVAEGIGQPGFVIGMYDPVKPLITIPFKPSRMNAGGSFYKMPVVSTTREEYENDVAKYIRLLGGDKNKKIVASRVIVENPDKDAADTFFDFCNNFHDAYVFCFSTPSTGCWIGASPELLLEMRDSHLYTMALAGTRKYSDNLPWDKKNMEEQEIVERYIIGKFKDRGFDVQISGRYSKTVGDLQHICTDIYAPEPVVTAAEIETFIKSFSPTPALCGYPKEMALESIASVEKFDRGCYGGFCGFYRSISDFSFNVILRCASYSEGRRCIYVGGGITAKSTAQSEWLETEAKFKNTFTR